MSCLEAAEKKRQELLASGRCATVEIAGSLRRGEYSAHDADLICFSPDMRMNTSTRESLGRVNDCPKVEVYTVNPKHYGAFLFYLTGPSGYQIGQRRRAQERNMLLNQYGLFDRATGKLIASETEEEIFKALDKPYKVPELRGK